MARPREGGLAANVQGGLSARDIIVRRLAFEPGLDHGGIDAVITARSPLALALKLLGTTGGGAAALVCGHSR